MASHPTRMRPITVHIVDTDGGNSLGNADDPLIVKSNSSSGIDIPLGNVTGKSVVHKFGEAPDFDTGDGSVNIWDGANDTSPNLMTYTYSSTADIDSLSSSDNSDTQDVEVQGLDISNTLTVQTVTLTGQTRVAIPTALKRVFRLKNQGSTNNAGTVYCFKNIATTGGVPNTLANIRALMRIGNNQTLMALYTIPAGKTGLMTDFWASSVDASKDTEYKLRLEARPGGGVFQLKHESSFSDAGGSHIQHTRTMYEKFDAETDIQIKVSIIGVGVTGVAVSAGFDIILVDD